jgi:Xaa-Pro aminopeptidase
MSWTISVCEAGMWRMYENSLPGRTENQIWAELHYENIRNGGEWLETRLLAAGRRTNPWFQESSAHTAQTGDLLAFDTDLIGPYGYCADLSRTWTIGHTPATAEQRALYRLAREQIDHNLALLRPGLTFAEFNAKSWRIPDQFVANRYPAAIHGVGLCDEYPLVPAHPDFPGSYDGTFEEGMVVCVESYIGAEGGKEGVKLEIQVLIGKDGTRRLDTFPFEDWSAS